MTPGEHAKVWRSAAEKLRQRTPGYDGLTVLVWLAEAVAESYDNREPKDIPHG